MNIVSLLPDCSATVADTPTLEDYVSHVLAGELDDVATLVMEDTTQTVDGAFEKNHVIAAASADSADQGEYLDILDQELNAAPVSAIVKGPDAVSVSVVQIEVTSVAVAHESANGVPESCHQGEDAKNFHDQIQELMNNYFFAYSYLLECLHVAMADSSGCVPEDCYDAVYPCKGLTMTSLHLFCPQFFLEKGSSHQTEQVVTTAFGCRCLDLDQMYEIPAFVPQSNSQ